MASVKKKVEKAASKARRKAEASIKRPPGTRAELQALGKRVIGRMRKRPGVVTRHGGHLVAELFRAITKDAPLEKSADRRFSDPSWNSRRWSRALVKVYLAAYEEAMALVHDLELQGRDAVSARLLATLLMDAIAPSNLILTNPAALEKARQTKGKSLLRGTRNLVTDLWRHAGIPTQVDPHAFSVGKNLAITPGDVVFRSELLELIQYRPQTEQVYARPLLMVPPEINKYYVLDLSPENSLVRSMVGRGYQVFMISWRNPRPEHRSWGISDYVGALLDAHSAVLKITGSADANWLGVCAGGLTAAMGLGYLAAKRQLKTVNTLSTAVTLLDARGLNATNMSPFFSAANLERVGEKVSKLGVLEGRQLATMFSWIRANDLIWNYWVNNYLLGNDPPVFDVLYWNSDCTAMPAQLYSDFAVDLVGRNALALGEPLKVCGAAIALKKVEMETFVVAGQTDHITPWRGCYQTTQLLNGPSQFVLFKSGHVQTLVTPPGNRKAVFLTNSNTPASPDEWLETASPQNGSWWDHWDAWLSTRSGERAAAASSPGHAEYPSLQAAPGSYVL